MADQTIPDSGETRKTAALGALCCDEASQWKGTAQGYADQMNYWKARAEAAEALLNTPLYDDFVEAVTREAAHQMARWGREHDAAKTPEDWFWLLAYLAGKALRAHMEGDADKAKHHTISSAAALLHWHGSVE